MRAAYRLLTKVQERAPTDDRGQSTAEYLALSAVMLLILVTIVSPRVQDIISGILDQMVSALPG